MKLTVNEIVGLNKITKAIIEDETTKVDALVKFKLLGIMKETEFTALTYEEVRVSKIQEYGTEREDGTIAIEPESEYFSKFQEEMKTLLMSDVELKIVKLQPQDVFNRGIKAEYLTTLYPIIDAENQE